MIWIIALLIFLISLLLSKWIAFIAWGACIASFYILDEEHDFQIKNYIEIDGQVFRYLAPAVLLSIIIFNIPLIQYLSIITLIIVIVGVVYYVINCNQEGETVFRSVNDALVSLRSLPLLHKAIVFPWYSEMKSSLLTLAIDERKITLDRDATLAKITDIRASIDQYERSESSRMKAVAGAATKIAFTVNSTEQEEIKTDFNAYMQEKNSQIEGLRKQISEMIFSYNEKVEALKSWRQSSIRKTVMDKLGYPDFAHLPIPEFHTQQLLISKE